jgi:hypothetical protein
VTRHRAEGSIEGLERAPLRPVINLEAPMAGPVYALNLFNVADRDE